MAALALCIFGILAVAGRPGRSRRPPDSLPSPRAETLYVIPAGPVAGSFTPAARLTIDDTIAGWARIRVEGWVPVGAVLDRLQLESATPGPAKVQAAHLCCRPARSARP